MSLICDFHVFDYFCWSVGVQLFIPSFSHLSLFLYFLWQYVKENVKETYTPCLICLSLLQIFIDFLIKY